MSIARIIVVCFFSLLSTVVLAEVKTFPKCNTSASNEPCHGNWVGSDNSFNYGLVENGLLNGRGQIIYGNGVRYTGDFKDGWPDGYGVLIYDDAPSFKGQIAVGRYERGGRFGATYTSWPNGWYFFGWNRGENFRGDRRISYFREWKRAFYDLAMPQRKAVQTVLAGVALSPERRMYNSTIDGVWGRNTLDALAIYAALMKPEKFKLAEYDAAQSVLRDILVTGAQNAPLGYIISDKDPVETPKIPTCPDQPKTAQYKCIGSIDYEDGSVYSGQIIDGLPNGPGELTDEETTLSGVFENGELIGQGKVIKNGKTIWEGNWTEFSEASEQEAGSDEIAQKLTPSTGSGFFVTDSGHIVSNNHVIEGCSFVTGTAGGITQKLQVLASDPVNDLSLLYGPDLKGAPVKFRETPMDLGEEVWVAGYPFGDAISSTIKLTKGIVSSLSGIQNDYTKFQIDAAMQPGNSGGPVLSSEGELLGVSVYKLDEKYTQDNFGVTPENTNFAINIQLVKLFLMANSITQKSTPLESTKIGDIAKEVTVFIGCNR